MVDGVHACEVHAMLHITLLLEYIVLRHLYVYLYAAICNEKLIKTEKTRGVLLLGEDAKN